MDNKESILSVLTDDQKNFLEGNFTKLSESDLFQKISEIGPAMDRRFFGEILREMTSKVKENILKQKLSDDELLLTSGGLCGFAGHCPDNASNNCTELHHRDIYGGAGFPNCAATVGYSSWCWSNDACYSNQVVYDNRKTEECTKAWK